MKKYYLYFARSRLMFDDSGINSVCCHVSFPACVSFTVFLGDDKCRRRSGLMVSQSCKVSSKDHTCKNVIGLYLWNYPTAGPRHGSELLYFILWRH